MRVRLSLLAIPLSVSYGLFAQVQSSYFGSDITGQLTKTATVSAKQQVAGGFQALGTGQGGPETKPNLRRLSHPPFSQRGSQSTIPIPAPPMQSLPVSTTTTSVSFLGLTHMDQRLADNGNQFSVEPSNQSIASGNGYVLEGVNNAIEVYTTAGDRLLPGVLTSNRLFGVPAAIDRNTLINGVFPTDMRVFYDHGIDRWFVLQRAQDNDVFGNNLNSSHLYIAVSQTNDPTGTYNVYTMVTTNTGHPGCPCLTDYPQIGADQYGFYVSTNEYDTFFSQFVDVRILAISKASLALGVAVPTLYDFTIPRVSGYEFTVHPASTPPGASYFLASGGVEFFLSTQSSFSSDSGVGLWALTNTASLGTAHPNLTLLQTVVPALPYSFPDVAVQRPGALPYGSSLSPPGLLAFLDGGDSRVQSLVYSGGRLFVTLGTQVVDENGRFLVGGAYVIFLPTFRNGILAAPVQKSGYLMVKGNHLLRPAIAVDPRGRGAIVFTLAGLDYYPSAALVPIDTVSIGPAVQISSAGFAPEDGFSGYPDGVARWGDYSSAVATADGSIWMVTEYIPNAPRTPLADWGTRVIQYKPSP